MGEEEEEGRRRLRTRTRMGIRTTSWCSILSPRLSRLVGSRVLATSDLRGEEKEKLMWDTQAGVFHGFVWFCISMELDLMVMVMVGLHFDIACACACA